MHQCWILKKKKARNAEIPVWSAADIGAHPNQVGQKGSPTWVEKVFSPEQKTRGELLTGEADEVAGRLVEVILKSMS